MADIRLVKIGDIVTTNASSYSSKDHWEYVNYLDTGNITQNVIDSIQRIDLSQEKLPSRAKRKVRENSIVYSTVRPNQLHYGIIRNQLENFLVSTGFTVIDVDERQAVAEYVYYFLTQKEIVESLQAIGEQSVSTYPSIKPSDIEDIEIPLPSLDIQNKIVGILKSLDAKIKTNSDINNNLEEQMQALFSECLSLQQTADSVTVEQVVLTANTGADAIQKAPIVDYDTGIKCVRVGDMTNKRSYHDWGFAKVTEEVFKRYQLHKDDIVVTRTASLGLNAIIFEDLSAVYNNGLIRLTVNPNMVLPLFLYRQFQTEDFANYISRIESETSVRPNMKINYLLKYTFKLPSVDKQNELVKLLLPMIVHQNSIIDENKKLESLRDALLSKLMTGELDVSDVEI